MLLALITLQATANFAFLAVPNVTYDKDLSKDLTNSNSRHVEYFTVSWPWAQFLSNASAELSADHWVTDDRSQNDRSLIYFDKGDKEISYSRAKIPVLARLTFYPSTPTGRRLADARHSFVSWLEASSKSIGFGILNDGNDDNTILFPFGISDFMFYIVGGHSAPLRLYRFDKGQLVPTWSVPLAPFKGNRSELAGTLRRYIGNANSALNTLRNEMVSGEIPGAAKKDLEASQSLVHMFHRHGDDTGWIQGGYIDPTGRAHYIDNNFIGRDCQSPWAEEVAWVGKP